MRRQFIVFSILVSLSGFAQQNNTGIPIPMKNEIVFYEQAYPLTNMAKKEEFYKKAVKWFNESFPGSKEKITVNKSEGKISGKGVFKVITNESAGHYYWLKPDITITVRDDGYTFQAYNYYEKPIMPGVTNDYSKIEYRWRDFRKGKPWNPEDEALFKGLDQQTLSLMTSLEKKMSQ